MSTQVTSTDLDQWSHRRDTQGQLPGLVRRLIMATVRPERIRFPAHEGIALPGLDGILKVAGSAGPFVPAGDSAWEASTEARPRSKATRDYMKRTKQTGATERAVTTFVFVTTRTFGDAEAWVKEMEARSDGWKAIQVIDAQDLATWLETCPGVHAWLANELGRPLGIVELRQWFDRWSAQTDPATPAALLLAGRRSDAIEFLNELDGHPKAVERCATSVEEVVAFVAASLLLGPGPAPERPTDDAPVPPDGDGLDVDDTLDSEGALGRAREPEELEALLARCVVVENVDAWRRWSHHDQPHILIPLFYPDSVQEAVDAGHHVVLPRGSNDAHDQGRLAPLQIDAARTAWAGAGVEFRSASEYATASRRNLRSLRRRIARHRRHRTPEWASGPSASLLGALLLAGSWDTSYEGDVEVVLALTERTSWKALGRDLVILTGGDDPPLIQTDKRWRFVDAVDAWDAVGTNLVPEDVEVLLQHAVPALTEPDPAMHLRGEERVKFALDPDRPRRRHSSVLRKGLVTTIAVLGSVVRDAAVGGHWTGQALANLLVHDLLHRADADRWVTLSGHLPLLAEAAPNMFLDAVESALAAGDAPVMALFNEVNDGFGQQRSHHSPLLWALETLAFSREHVSRVATVLARLTDLDPGGELANRPLESLTSMLHLAIPQGAVDTSNRLDVVDAVRRAAPTVGPKVMRKLISVSSSGMLIRNGPRYRAWPPPRTSSTYGDIAAGIDALTERILEDTPRSGEWSELGGLIGRLTPAGRRLTLEAVAANWESMTTEAQAAVSTTVRDVADRHRRFPEAGWSMGNEGVAELDTFLATFGTLARGEPDVSLFGWWPKTIDMTTDEGRQAAGRRRVEAAAEAAEAGIDAVRELARAAEVAHMVGHAVADATGDLDEPMLDLLDAEDPKERDAASGLVAARAKTPGWLAQQVAARPTQAAALLLSLEVTTETLDLLRAASDEQRSLFWSGVNPYRYSDDVLSRFVDELLSADRPYSAIDALAMSMNEPAPAEVTLRAMAAPLNGTQEQPSVLTSPEYVIGSLLDQLEVAGVDPEDLARLEFFYLPLLTEERQPRALQTKLARQPEFFADVVAQVYRPDDEVDGGTVRDTEESAEAGADGVGDSEAAEGPGEPMDDASSDARQFSRVCWELLHGWRDPMPGTASSSTPDPDLMHAWVTKARAELADRRRAGVASMVIGEALAGTATDEDGTWPCLAVRKVLQLEQDADLERHLLISRRNQRGVTVRSPYEGGAQERKLAKKYRRWADAVRDQWPRSGKLLDEIADDYEADARREDKQAERYIQE